jgi:hypothetical protein
MICRIPCRQFDFLWCVRVGTRSDTAAHEGFLLSIERRLPCSTSTMSDIYGYDLLMLRPDLDVVWRGNRPLDNPAELAAIATGHHVSRGRPWNE